MPQKRTIDAYFSAPKPKKPRNSDPVALGRTSTITPTTPQARGNKNTEPTNHPHHSTVPSGGISTSGSTTTHPSYPFPIPRLPDILEAEIAGPPARAARAVADQPDLDLLYFEPYVSRRASRRLFEFLRSALPFYRVEYDIVRGGAAKTHIRTPRWTTVFGLDETARFEDSPASNPDATHAHQPLTGRVLDARTGNPIPVGQTEAQGQTRQTGHYKATPRPVPHCLDVLRKSAEAATGCRFNFCLVNYYASGADGISFHSDDERFLGPLPAIASFSLGASRDFLMKHKQPKPGPGRTATSEASKASLKLPLVTGDMVLMRGGTQANWLHSIPKRSGRNEWDGGRINITFRRALVRGGTENYYQYNVGSGPVYKWNAAAQQMRPWVQGPEP